VRPGRRGQRGAEPPATATTPPDRLASARPLVRRRLRAGTAVQPRGASVKAPLGQRLRTLLGREHLAALFARWFPRRIDRILLALIAVVIIAGTVLRLDVIGTNDRVSTDENAYVLNADRILQDRPFVTFKWAPGTSLMFAAAAVLRGYSAVAITTHAHGVAQYSQLVVELATLILIALIAWIFAGPWAALLAALLMATYEPLIDVTRTYLSEPLGGLGLITMVAAVCWARKRSLHSLVLAGIVAGAAGLVREDLAIVVAVIVIGLFVNGWPNRRAALGRALLYGVAALATVMPFVIYASLQEHEFTPIVDAGPHALYLGTYLPGGGNQFFDVSAESKQVCAYFNRRHLSATQAAAISLPSGYCHLPPGDAQGLFALIQAKHPGESTNGAAESAALENLNKYLLGEPLKFAHMLWNKAWNMWSLPWSGGNSAGGGGLARTTSVFQHQLYSVIAWLGMLLGLVVLRRRWAFVVPVLGLLAAALLNTFFAITPRDNVRFMPFVFLFGAVGAIAALRWLIERVRELCSKPALA
jgi:4-amino-4-deoxy-L-arabinose transferase-like glycosyltransferase